MTGAAGPAAELAARIARHGSVGYDELVEVALYHPDGGFFAAGGGAGRAGADFVTSPEVGPLFGAVVARYLDARWDELGRPDPFVVVEAGAGRGALALAVLAAAPRCAPALRYVLVERSAELRARQGEHLPLVHPFEVLGPQPDPELDSPPPGQGVGPLVCGLEDLPAQRIDGVVLANELLDNVPFRLAERTAEGWAEVRVTLREHRPAELLAALDDTSAELLDRLAPDAQVGSRVPVQDRAAGWLARARELLVRGSVLVVDYASTTADLASRPMGDWLRTYRGHARGGDPLEDPGTQDVTCEVALDQLARVAPPTSDDTQAEWLRRWGIEELVEEGRRAWEAKASAPDLAAMRGRSRAVEAKALTDPDGLGDFRVLEWRR